MTAPSTPRVAPSPHTTSRHAARAAGLRIRAALGSWHLALPGLLTAVFAFRAGGFFPDTVGFAAVALAVVLVGRITLAERPFSGWSPGLAVMAGMLAVLAAWIVLSGTWSHAPARALPEFDRALLYGLVLVLAGGVAARTGDLALLLRWTLLALVAVALAAALSRLAPGLVPTAPGYLAERLSFPLTYWNADGILFALGVVLAFHVTASGREPVRARVAAAGALPVLVVALYLTFSRGALVAVALGIGLYVALAHSRGLASALLAAGPPTLVAAVAAYQADLLARADYAGPAARAQGRELLAILAGTVVAALVLRALALRLDRRLEAVPLAPARRRRILLGAAAAALGVAVVLGVALDAPGRLDRFRHDFGRAGLLPATADLRDRLTQTGSNGRAASWRVARDSFAAHPLLGTGAGTYRLAWQRERPAPPLDLTDAHSLYLEVPAELGVPGLVAILVVLLTPVAVALARMRGPERHALAAFLAAGVMLLLHAGVDWDWEMPALFAWYFGAAGVVLAARRGRGYQRSPSRRARVLGGLACLLLATTPWVVAGSQGPLFRAQEAFLAGDCRTAIDAALTSTGRLSVRPEPFEVLGFCDARLGQPALALAAMQAAQRRDPGNWEYAYGVAVVRAAAGQDPRPAAREALRLNPLDRRARELAAAVEGTSSPRRWVAIARRAALPVD